MNSRASIGGDSTASITFSSPGLAPTANPASNAHQVLADPRRRFQPGRQAGCRRVGDDILGRDNLLDAVLKHPVDVVAPAIPRAAELEHRRAVADFLHPWPVPVVLQLRTANQHERELTATFDNDFGEPLPRDRGLRMQVVCVVDELGDRLGFLCSKLRKASADLPESQHYYVVRSIPETPFGGSV